ncbi:MAG: hypothetical protein HQL39_10400 [Alphaproteobacteria bacterium]|nr:hypothetical protein [Alphaproteobacteria bacterium]
MTDRLLCGWRVAGGLPLPDLLPWSGDGRAADVVIDLGEVPAPPPDPARPGRAMTIEGRGACRLVVPGVARFLVDPDGRRVVVEPQPDAPQPLLRAFLLGRVLAILCVKRGLLPLHASCVRIGGRAHAFSGPRGTGKSTLAAAFLRRGHPVLADDLTVIDPAAPGGPIVWPAFPRLKLWRDAAQAMGLATDGLERVEWVGDKFHVPLAEGFHADPLPLAAIDHIENGEGETTRRPLAGMAAVEAMLGAVYRMRVALTMGAGPAVMADVARLCQAAPGFRLIRRPGLDEIDAVAARYGPS